MVLNCSRKCTEASGTVRNYDDVTDLYQVVVIMRMIMMMMMMMMMMTMKMIMMIMMIMIKLPYCSLHPFNSSKMRHSKNPVLFSIQ